MIRAGLLALVLAGPAGAQTVDCFNVWLTVSGGLNSVTDGQAVGRVGQDGDWCVVTDLKIDLPDQHMPDWQIDRLRFRGSALGWIVDGSTLPEGLEVAVEGLRLVVQTGDARMDWLLAAQARPNAIDAEMSLAWDPAARELRLESLSIDFPGEKRVEASARVTGVDLSSAGSMQMSATGFAVAEADLKVQMHGLFEWYALMALGPMILPEEGDMDAAAASVRTELGAGIAALPGESLSDATKAALAALVADLPNPSGDLTLALRAKPGIGPARFAGYAVTGAPQTLAEAAPLFKGVTLDAGWTHVDAP